MSSTGGAVVTGPTSATRLERHETIPTGTPIPRHPDFV